MPVRIGTLRDAEIQFNKRDGDLDSLKTKVTQLEQIIKEGQLPTKYTQAITKFVDSGLNLTPATPVDIFTGTPPVVTGFTVTATSQNFNGQIWGKFDISADSVDMTNIHTFRVDRRWNVAGWGSPSAWFELFNFDSLPWSQSDHAWPWPADEYTEYRIVAVSLSGIATVGTPIVQLHLTGGGNVTVTSIDPSAIGDNMVISPDGKLRYVTSSAANVLDNPSFEDVDGSISDMTTKIKSWITGVIQTPVTISLETTYQRTGKQCLKFSTSYSSTPRPKAALQSVPKLIPCRVGEQYYFELYVMKDAGTVIDGYNFTLIFYDKDGSSLGIAVDINSGVGWTNGVYVKVPMNVAVTSTSQSYIGVYADVTFHSSDGNIYSVYIDDTFMARQVGTSDILDLAVSQAKLADAAVIFQKLSDYSVSGLKLDNNAISRAAVFSTGVISNSAIFGALVVNDAAINTMAANKLSAAQITGCTMYLHTGSYESSLDIQNDTTYGKYYGLRVATYGGYQRTIISNGGAACFNSSNVLQAEITGDAGGTYHGGGIALYNTSAQQTIYATASNGEVGATQFKMGTGGLIDQYGYSTVLKRATGWPNPPYLNAFYRNAVDCNWAFNSTNWAYLVQSVAALIYDLYSVNHIIG